jgi:hypothetical protein
VAMPEPRSTHHLIVKTSMVGPLGSSARAQEHPPPYIADVDGGAIGGGAGARVCPPPYVEDDGGPPRRRCQSLRAPTNLC